MLKKKSIVMDVNGAAMLAEAITRPFPFNAFYGEDAVTQVDGDTWRLELSGQVADRKPWSLARLRALPQTDQIARHICIEGWSAIGKWGGVPFSAFLRRVGADLGYKNPKHIQAIFVTNTFPGGYWEDQGYNWFGGS